MLKQYDVAYFMASTDNIEDVTRFAEMHEADFPILSDDAKTMTAAYGVLGTAGYAKRWTFYINSEGTILHVDRNVSTRTAGPDLAANLERLGYPRAE